MTMSGKWRSCCWPDLPAYRSPRRQSSADTNSFSLISPAQARVGRPLTPVSVAGVARRTTRRCAAGVYNCESGRLLGERL